MPLIQNEGFIFVTSNGKDFLKLYADTDIHSGLIIVVHGNSRAEIQVRLFGLALDEAERLSYLTNKLVEVFEDGRVTVRDYPLEDAAGGSSL